MSRQNFHKNLVQLTFSVQRLLEMTTEDRMKLPSYYADRMCRAHDCDGTMLLMGKCNWASLFPINEHHILKG